MYTHTFKFELENSSVRGEVEFNTDGKVSFKLDNVSEPLALTDLSYFKRLMELLKEIYTAGGGIRKIKIIKK